MMVSWHDMTILYKISEQPFCLMAVRLLSWCLCILCSYNPLYSFTWRWESASLHLFLYLLQCESAVQVQEIMWM